MPALNYTTAGGVAYVLNSFQAAPFLLHSNRYFERDKREILVDSLACCFSFLTRTRARLPSLGTVQCRYATHTKVSPGREKFFPFSLFRRLPLATVRGYEYPMRVMFGYTKRCRLFVYRTERKDGMASRSYINARPNGITNGACAQVIRSRSVRTQKGERPRVKPKKEYIYYKEN